MAVTERITSTTPKEFVASRISVFDAATLDREINGFLKKQIHHVISELPSNGIPDIDPEIDAALRIFLWVFSVERNGATFGQQLLRLKYANDVSRGNLRLLAVLTIGYSYLKNRSHFFRPLKEKLPSWADFAVKHFEFTVNVLNFFSLLIFLRKGGSLLFIEKLLGIRPASTVKPSERSIGYSYMTRALLWHGAIELCCLVLPHVNIPKLGRIARNAVFGKSAAQPTSRPPVFSTEVKCSICHQTPIIPHTIGCQHFFCFLCISSCLLADSKYECPDCGYSNPEGLATRWEVK